jgi:predicted PurR-regulated permease PerM
MNFGQSLGFLSFLISLYILWQIRQLLLLIFFAVILAVALNRLVNKLKKFNFNRSTAVFIIVTSIIIIFNLLLLVILPPFIEQFQLLLSILPTVPEKINELINAIESSNYYYWKSFPGLDTFFEDYNFLPDNLLNHFIAFFSNIFIIIFQVIFVLVLTVVLLLNPQKYRGYFRKLFPSFYRHRVDDILDKSEIAIVSWLGGITINSLFIGSLSGIGLLVLQVKLLLVHALLAGLLNFIPNIGPAASVIFPIMIAVVDSPWKILPILVWYFIIQNIESYWLTPRVMAQKVSLLPAVTLFAQIFFATIFGLLGLLLALPLTVVSKTWIEEVLFYDILDPWAS